MPIQTNRFSLAEDVAQRLVSSDNMVQEVHIHNHEHSQNRDLYVGATDAVSETTGHHVLAGADIVFSLMPGDDLWGITPDSSGCIVTVMQVQKSD